MPVVSIDYSVFPYLADIGDVLSRWPGLTIVDLAADTDGVVFARSLELLREILGEGRVRVGRYDVETEVAAFHVAVLLLRLVGERRALSRFAVAYSKLAYEHLRGMGEEAVAAIGARLGLRIEYARRGYVLIPVGFRRGVLIYRRLPLRIWFRDYLRYAARLSTDPKYAPVNQVLDKGWFYLDKEIASRVLEEAVYHRIMSMYSDIPEAGERLASAVAVFREAVMKHYGSSVAEAVAEGGGGGETSGGIVPEAYPPCIKAMIERLRAGENLSHHERFTVAAFLARIGMDVEDILDLFRNAPDFNERIARYQIEHIAGLRGSRKKYMPYSCSTLKSLGLCPVEGDCGARNPLAVYRRNLWRMRRRKKRAGESGGSSNSSNTEAGV